MIRIKEVKIKTDKMELSGNVLRYDDSIIQLSNISFLSIGKQSPKKYPFWAILGAIASFVAMVISSSVWLVWVSLLCVVFLTYVFLYNQELTEYLIIDMNCGKSLLFPYEDRVFLKRVVDTLQECFEKESGQCKIDFYNCKISDLKMAQGNIIEKSNVIGDGNTGDTIIGDGNSTVGDTTVIKGADDWETAANIFAMLSQKYFDGSDEKQYCNVAYQYCKSKNENKLKELIWKNQGIFKMIFFRAATTGIEELLKKLIGLVL